MMSSLWKPVFVTSFWNLPYSLVWWKFPHEACTGLCISHLSHPHSLLACFQKVSWFVHAVDNHHCFPDPQISSLACSGPAIIEKLNWDPPCIMYVIQGKKNHGTRASKHFTYRSKLPCLWARMKARTKRFKNNIPLPKKLDIY